MHFTRRKLIWINLFADLNWFFLSSSPDLWYLLSLQQSVACLWVDSILNWGYKWLIAEIQTESLNLWPKILRFGEPRWSKNRRFGEGEVRECSQSPFLGVWGICQVLWEDVIYQARVIWSQQATVAGMKEVARAISLLRFIRNILEVLTWSIKGQVREF